MFDKNNFSGYLGKGTNQKRIGGGKNITHSSLNSTGSPSNHHQQEAKPSKSLLEKARSN